MRFDFWVDSKLNRWIGSTIRNKDMEGWVALWLNPSCATQSWGTRHGRCINDQAKLNALTSNCIWPGLENTRLFMSHTIPRLIREMAVIVRRLTVPSWVFLSDRNSILNIRLNVYHFWIQNRVPSDPKEKGSE